MIKKFHAGDMEMYLARYYGYRQCLIVPNVSWGLGFRHELDLLIVRQSGWAIEIEIKTSLSDLRADKKKWHEHYSQKIKMLYFAVPLRLLNRALRLIPERAGLFVIREKYTGRQRRVFIAKNPIVNKTARKLTHDEIDKLRDLAAMRMWNLKEHNYRLLRDIEYYRNEKPPQRRTRA